MCGRYQFQLHNQKQIDWLKKHHIDMNSFSFLEGERFPSNQALVLIWDNNQVVPKLLKWGFSSFHPLLINARVESLIKRKTFQSLLHQRCVILTNGFYEWHQEKNRKVKYHIKDENQYLYLAGLYNEVGEFVILTCSSNKTMSQIHSRCPLTIKREQIIDYLKLGKIPTSVQEFIYTKCD